MIASWTYYDDKRHYLSGGRDGKPTSWSAISAVAGCCRISSPAPPDPDPTRRLPSSTRDKQSAVEIGRNVERIFAYGIRNKLRDTDSSTGLSGGLWQQENGEDAFDELNRVERGMNSARCSTSG